MPYNSPCIAAALAKLPQSTLQTISTAVSASIIVLNTNLTSLATSIASAGLQMAESQAKAKLALSLASTIGSVGGTNIMSLFPQSAQLICPQLATVGSSLLGAVTLPQNPLNSYLTMLQQDVAFCTSYTADLNLQVTGLNAQLIVIKNFQACVQQAISSVQHNSGVNIG
jgi:hypothetical protein